MKHIIIAVSLFVFAAVAWHFGPRFSADALGFVLGLLFSMMAWVPTVLLALYGEKRR